MSARRTAADRHWVRRQYTAPRRDRAVLCEPSDAAAAGLIESNRAVFAESDAVLCDRPLSRVRQQARCDVLAAAREFTEHVRGVPVAEPDIEGPLIVAGHQPELYHPGVWLKNFAASRLAAATGGTALNLIVDTDLCGDLTLALPGGTADQPRTWRLPLDTPARQLPWEDVRVRTPSVLPAAGPAIAEGMQRWGIEPLAAEIWPDARQVQTGDCLVSHLTQLRHNRQQAWDTPLLELPMRTLCRLPSFALFVCFVLRQIDQLRPIYNEGLAIYRELNRLRSSAHPMPDLASVEVDGQTRHEAPMWVWRAGEHHRRPLWIEQLGCSFRLYDVGEGDHADAECLGVIRRTDCDADAWHRLLCDLDQQGIRVRPRALMTTLFLRLCLADLFAHGIGGAKYDEVTDYLLRRFIGVQPPRFLTISGTLKLPLPRHAATPDDRRSLRSRRWDLLHNADRHGFGSPELRQRKQQLIAEQQAASAAAARGGAADALANLQRFRDFKAINLELAAAASEARGDLAEELADVNRQLAANRLLGSREFSWVLYPEELLRDWLFEASEVVVDRLAVA